MDQLVLKAHFEEAKSKELSSSKPAAQPKVASRVTSSISGGDPPISTSRSSEAKSTPPYQTLQRSEGGQRKCFKCRLEGQIVRTCPYPRSSKRNVEARGRKEGRRRKR